MKRLAVLTSGGDSPGMNAAIRAVVRTASHYQMDTIGIIRGYQGLVDGLSMELNNRSVSNTIQRGGTILRSARSQDFKTPEGRARAAANLQAWQADALLVIGGDGSMRGLQALSAQWPGQVIGLPGTIDNDLYGTDYTIGYFTALDTALDAIDKIRDTADAIDRVFLVEVMGRMAGFIAQGVGIAGGAEEILVPEQEVDITRIATDIVAAREKGKGSFIIVVAEGACEGGAGRLARTLEEQTGIECRPCILGHIQRGGSPAALDRILATKLGALAVEKAREGVSGVMVGLHSEQLVQTPLPDTWGKKKPLDDYLFSLERILAQ